MYNPFRIPVDQLNEREGTIILVVDKSNLFEEDIPLVRVLEIAKGQTVFILEREQNFDLRFIQSNPNYPTKIAKINIQGLSNAQKLFIALKWSKEKNTIYVGEIYVGDKKGPLKSAESFEEPDIKFRVGKDRRIYQIGTKGVRVKYYQVKMGNKVILEPTAKELFDFHMERIKVLIDNLENCKVEDPLFEPTIVQQVIVMFTTAFEVYARTRFVELEREDWPVNMEELYNRFVPKKYRDAFKEEISDYASKEEKTELEVFVEKRRINFQNWDDFKDAYDKGYGLKISEIGIPTKLVLDIQRFIKWRHKIIHSKENPMILNNADVPPSKPIFAKKEVAEHGFKIFQEFVNNFHKSTLRD